MACRAGVGQSTATTTTKMRPRARSVSGTRAAALRARTVMKALITNANPGY
jgi:hypothetical protein